MLKNVQKKLVRFIDTGLKQQSLSAWLGILAIFALFLRLPLLTDSFWLDEAAQALEVIRPWREQLNIAADFQPPLFHLILHLWQYIGHQEWWLRSVSLLSGLGSVMIFSALAWRWQGRRAGVIVGLLLATSSLHVFFSQELRPYMLAVFWSSLAMASYWSILFPQDGLKSLLSTKSSWPQLSKRTAFISLTLANLAGGLTSYVYLFFIVAQVLTSWLVGRRRAWLISKSVVLTGLAWLIWLPGLLSQLAASSALRTLVPDWEKVVSLTQAKALPLTVAKFWVGVLPIDLVWSDAIIVILPCIFVFYLGIKYWQSSAESAKKQLLTLLSLLVLTLATSWLFSFWTPVISPKRVLFLLPLMYWVIGLVTRQKHWLAGLLVIYALGLNLFSLAKYWQDPALQRENWRSAISNLEARYQPNDTVVVFGFDAPFAPWEWYQQKNLPTHTTGFKPLTSPESALQALSDLPQAENVILFDYLLDLSDPAHFVSKGLESKGYQLMDVLDYPNLGFIRLYYQKRLYARQELNSKTNYVYQEFSSGTQL